MNESNVVSLFRPASSAPEGVEGVRDVSMSNFREKTRRADVRDHIDRSLRDAFKDDSRVEAKLHLDGDQMLSVVAVIDGRVRQALTRGYPEGRIDDLAGIVRAGLPNWREVVGRRTSMRLVH